MSSTNFQMTLHKNCWTFMPCHKSMIYVLAAKWSITRMTIAWTLDPPPKKSSISLHIVTHLCQFMAQNSKIWGGKIIWQLFDSSKIFKNQHFLAQQMANQWLIQKFKPRYVEYPRTHLLTDSWSNQWMLLSCHKCVKKWTLCFYALLDPTKCVTSPNNGTTI